MLTIKKISEETIKIRSRLVVGVYQSWVKKRSKVLDVGCGNAVLSNILRNELTISLTGCDIEKYIKKDIPFVLLKNPTILPFENNSFDIVMFNDMLHHTSYANQKKLLKEGLRVSNKVLIYEDEPNLIETIVDWGINKIHNRHMPVILSFRKPAEWIKLFTELELTYEYKKVPKHFFYPLIHEAFCVSKKIKNKRS